MVGQGGGSVRPNPPGGVNPAAIGIAGGLILLGVVAAMLFTLKPEPESDRGPGTEIGEDLDLSAINGSGSESLGRSPGKQVGVKVEKVAPPPPPKPALGEFEFHHKRASSGSTYYVLGEVKNTGEVPLDHPKLIIVLKDEKGEEVGTDFGFSERDIIYPGESSPISALVNKPPPHASVEYELILKKATYFPKMVEGLELEKPKVSHGDWGKAMKAEGKVRNEGQQPARFVKIEVQGLDADGKLLGLYSTYADTEVLAPGQSARFSISSMYYDEEPANYEFYVSGRVAD